MQRRRRADSSRYVSNASDGDVVDALFRRSLVVAMSRLSTASNLYRTGFTLNNVNSESDPAGAGGSADIYKGKFQGNTVCIKAIRMYDYETHKISIHKAYSREAILWRQLSHPNLLPFLGLYVLPLGRLAFISPWAENGNVIKFLTRYPRANRPLLCSDVAAGLSYLHANRVIHGDLKGANVLVDRSWRAVVADFGLSAITDPQILHWTSHSSAESKGGTTRWQAPELATSNGSTIANTKESDVYAWGCVCYEIFTERFPFFEVLNRHDISLVSKVGADGTKLKPSRPLPSDPAWMERGLTETMWKLMDICWDHNPSERPTISFITRHPSFEITVDPRPLGEWVKSVNRFGDMHFRPPADEAVENLLSAHREWFMVKREEKATHRERELLTREEKVRKDEQELLLREENVRQKERQLIEREKNASWDEQEILRREQRAREKEDELSGKEEKVLEKEQELFIRERKAQVSEEELLRRESASNAKEEESRPQEGDLDVIAATAYATGSKSNTVFRGLWKRVKRVKPQDKPDKGMPLNNDDTMVNPPVSSRASSYKSNIPGNEDQESSPSPLHAEYSPTTPRANPPRTHDTQNGIIPLNEDIQRLFQECRIGLGSASLLSQAFALSMQGELEKNDVIKEFYLKCCGSQQLIFAQIPWASAGAEHTRRQRDQEALTNEMPEEQRTELTTMEKLLAALLCANVTLVDVLQQYDDHKRNQEIPQLLDMPN